MSNLAIAPQPWMDDARCRTEDEASFYPAAGQAGHNLSARAKGICAGCPVRIACLNYALEIGDQYGIYGGLDPIERQALKKATA